MNIPLFDANGCFGPTSAARPDFLLAADLLAHMDRLGVGRALVWHATARDQHPPTGNRRLLQEIADCPGARGRLVPVFGAMPGMLYEHEGLRALEEVFDRGQSRALKICLGGQRHRLEHFDPIFEKLAPHRPLTLCSVREGMDLAGLAQFAPRHPSVRFVVQHVMWGGMAALLDLMRRCENVLCEISWMHTSGTLELLCARFGASRVVFGLGPKAHQGAAIAALACAGISGEQRAAIAHGNLDALLSLSPTPPAASSLADDPDKKLWRRLLGGEQPGVEILDAHSHLGANGIWLQERQELADQIPQALADMDRLGIRTMFVAGMEAMTAHPVEGNLRLAADLRPHGDRFRGWMVYNPNYAAELERHLPSFLSDPFFVGFKLWNDYWRAPVTDPRFKPMWRCADRLRLPILLHTWDTPYNSPVMLRKIAAAHPGASFLLGHSGGGDRGRMEAVALARACPNVYLEWCGSFCSGIPWEETLRAVGPRRVIFGTDAVVHSFFWELGRLLSLEVPDETLKPVLAGNFRAILARRKIPLCRKPKPTP